jgi:hypothetical protein
VRRDEFAAAGGAVGFDQAEGEGFGHQAVISERRVFLVAAIFSPLTPA